MEIRMVMMTSKCHNAAGAKALRYNREAATCTCRPPPSFYEGLCGKGPRRFVCVSEVSLFHIGPHGAELLATALKENLSIKLLDIRDNGIGDTGAIFLAEALKLNQTLQSLNLSG